MHAEMNEAERAIVEPVIFSKSVDYRRDVKRGMSPDAATDAQLAAYKERIRK